MQRRTRAPAQALVEFALVISAFTLVMLAIFDWSRVFGTYISLTNATREAARQAQVVTNTTNPLSAADAQAIVTQAVLSFTLPLGPGGFTATPDVCLFAPGTVLNIATTDPCNPAANGNHTPYGNSVRASSSGTGGVLAVHASYNVMFLPMMSAIMPNGVTFSAATVTVLE